MRGSFIGSTNIIRPGTITDAWETKMYKTKPKTCHHGGVFILSGWIRQ